MPALLQQRNNPSRSLSKRANKKYKPGAERRHSLETIKIRGGRPLHGNVKVGGSKNDTVAIMAGALLVPGKTVLRNVPRIRDVNTLIEIFSRLGAVCTFLPDGSLEIDASNLSTSVAPNELV